MPITNGTISILRRVRTGDFEHIEPHVTISFSVEAGEDAEAVANGTRMIVDAQYKHLLGIAVEPEKKTRTKAEKPAGPLSPSADAPVTTPTVAPVQPSAPVAGPVAPTAPPASAPVVLPSPSTVAAPGAAFDAAGRPTVPVAPPAAVIAPVTVATTSTQAVPAVVPGVAPVVPAAGPTEAAIGLVSDEMMAKRCQDKTDELNALYEPGVGLQKVVALIRQYISPPGRATQIPHESREAFLTNLSALA